MKLRLLALPAALLAPSAGLAGPSEHFTLAVSFHTPAKDRLGAVSVTFTARDPDVSINEEPAPRLKLDPAQQLLADRQPPPSGRVPVFDPESVRYLDTTLPVSFPVAWASAAPKTPQRVRASVVYFYCSKREGWCRKGKDEIEFEVP